MAINKGKAIEVAQKLVAAGKLKEAISEYLKIYQADPKDQTVLNTLGDLHVSLKNNSEAINYYEKLADVYVGDGFLVRGIAMYKKITKLEPANIHAMERLADLYTMQGLFSEARAQFMTLAEGYLKSNQADKAMGVMQKVLDLDPENVKIQQKLAELYERHNQAAGAAGIYRRLAERALQQEHLDDATKWLQKASGLAPGTAEILLLEARVDHKAGRVTQALHTLERIPHLADHPEAVELSLSLHIQAGDAAAAEKLAEKLFSADQTKFSGFLQLALHFAEKKDGARALGFLQRVAEPALEHDAFHLLDAARSVANLLPTSPQALDLLVRAARASGVQTTLLEALSMQAQAAAAADDHARAKELYDELVTLDPNNLEFSQQLNQTREALGEPARPAVAQEAGAPSVEAPLAFAQELQAAPAEAPPPPAPVEAVVDEETQAYINASLTDIDLFSSYGMADKAQALALEVVARAPHHLVANEKLLDMYVGGGNATGIVEVASRLEELYRKEDNLAKAEAMSKLLATYGGKAAAEAPAAAAVAAAPEQEVDLSAEWAASTEPAAAAAPAPVEAAPAFNAAEATQEIDFYLSQGMTDMAREAVARHEQQFPGEPAVAELRARVEAAAAAAAAPAAEALPVEAAPAADAGVHEISFDAEQASAEAPAPVAEEGGTYELVLEEQPKAAEPAPAAAAASDFFSDLAGELDQALSGVSAPPAAKAPDKAAPPKAKAPAAGPAPPMGVLAEVFEEFKSEMGEVEEVEDIESHYNLGIAYKEMGLMDEAISEFQKVAKSAEKTQSWTHLFQVATLLGICFVEKGMPLVAVRWYERALKTPGIDEEGALALRYDMGSAYEAAGNRKAALDCFMEVYGSNVDYRDVGERIKELQGA